MMAGDVLRENEEWLNVASLHGWSHKVVFAYHTFASWESSIECCSQLVDDPGD
jgi:hypothetical protein